MVSRQVIIINELGIHARPASLLIHTAKKYQSACTLSRGGESAKFSSLSSLMKLRVKKGDTVTISADGPDEKDALTDIAALMEGSFGETAGIQNPVKKP